MAKSDKILTGESEPSLHLFCSMLHKIHEQNVSVHVGQISNLPLSYAITSSHVIFYTDQSTFIHPLLFLRDNEATKKSSISRLTFLSRQFKSNFHQSPVKEPAIKILSFSARPRDSTHRPDIKNNSASSRKVRGSL